MFKIRQKSSYSSDVDYLVAAILYLGTHSYYWARTPSHLAAELSLDEQQLKLVFERYPGLFRKSGKPSKNGQHFYSLQVRYAQREGKDTSDPEQISYVAPLNTEKLKMLVDFVKESADREVEQRNRSWTNFIAMSAAVVSATAAILVALLKSN